MAIAQGFSHKVAPTEAVGADDKDFGLAHGSSISITLLRRAVALMGVLPMVSTARAAMQQAKAAVGIIACPLASPVANSANSESPAPATSRGFTDRAGKAWLLS